jgi:hypothetical protein
MSRGCRMIRCPRCAYEFVEEGVLVSLVRRFLPKGVKRVPSTD